MNDQIKIVISGGGTGGHLFPALAIRDEINNRYPKSSIHYIGSKFGIEKDVLPIKYSTTFKSFFFNYKGKKIV